MNGIDLNKKSYLDRELTIKYLIYDAEQEIPFLFIAQHTIMIGITAIYSNPLLSILV